MKIFQIRIELEHKTDYDDIASKPQSVFKGVNDFFGKEPMFDTHR